jgi:hypothetical protein
MGEQSIQDYIQRNTFESVVLLLALVLAMLAYRKRKDPMLLLFAIAAGCRLLPTAANLVPYPAFIFGPLWAMYHGAPIVALVGLALSLDTKKQPNQALEPTAIAVTFCAYAQPAPSTAVAHL